jgi:hypothetical protein
LPEPAGKVWQGASSTAGPSTSFHNTSFHSPSGARLAASMPSNYQQVRCCAKLCERAPLL